MAETETTAWSGRGVGVETIILNPVPMNSASVSVNDSLCYVNGPKSSVAYPNTEDTSWTEPARENTNWT